MSRLSSSRSLLTSVLSSLTYLHLASPTYHLLYCHSHLPAPHWPHCPDRKGRVESLSSPNIPGWGLQSPLPGSAEELEERFTALFSRFPPSIFTQSYKTTTTFSVSVSTRIAVLPVYRRDLPAKKERCSLTWERRCMLILGSVHQRLDPEPSPRWTGWMGDAKPIRDLDDRAQPIRTRAAWRTRGRAWAGEDPPPCSLVANAFA